MAKILIGKYEGSIYAEDGGWIGALSLGIGSDGKRKRIKRRGRTKTEVRDKLQKVVKDLESGIKSEANYTVAQAVEDWLSKGTKALDPDTASNYRTLANGHIIPLIGKARLGELRVDDVDDWLDGLTGKLSTRTLNLVHGILKRSIKMAQVREKVGRNVAELTSTPKGKPGRPSRALNREQSAAVLTAAESSRLHAYIVVSLTTGIRTEEARELRWDHVVAWVEDREEWRPVTEVGFEHQRFAIYVWRSVRKHGDTKTKKSRRTLELPTLAVDALGKHHARQETERLQAGDDWQDHGLAFCSTTGRPLDAANVRRAFRLVTKKAGIGEDWTPRELRHSFVSIMSDSGVSIENIADLCGHASTAVTEEVYRKQLKPVIKTGADAMNNVFGAAA